MYGSATFLVLHCVDSPLFLFKGEKKELRGIEGEQDCIAVEAHVSVYKGREEKATGFVAPLIPLEFLLGF